SKLGNVSQYIPAQVDSSSTVDSQLVYKVLGRDVSGARTEAYRNVNVLGTSAHPVHGSPCMTGTDKNGERFFIPQIPQLLIIEDVGGSQGKNVEIDENGTASDPSGQETLDYVIAESTSFFIDSTPPTKTGRRYPGLKLNKSDNSGAFYLVFVEGQGDTIKTLQDTTTAVAGSVITFQVETDGQGNVVAINLS
ncbi:MAG: hypothetical protein MI923_21070, partial [Phycisphaerales bacterium]|nr:hypothetical protein [Phycisphaerales bacterium]